VRVQGSKFSVRHREPPLGGAAIQAEQTVLRAWIASSQALLAMTNDVVSA
jgi:hypothetical protein